MNRMRIARAGDRLATSGATVRFFSTPGAPSPITPETIKASEIKVAKHKQYMRASVYPADLKYVGSGSELHVPKNITELAVFSGMPEEHKRRTVVIAPRVYKTLQSGDRTLNQYQLTWKHRERWTNPLMGWSSSADPQAMVKLTFDSLEDARAFAEKNGWKYEVRQPVSEKTVEPGSYNYSHNFLTAKTLDILKNDGPEAGARLYHAPGYGKSNWFMPLTFHGDQEVEQFGPRPAGAK